MTIGIRGLGLIGGSFEQAFAALGHEVVNLKTSPAADLPRCSLVIVCLPPKLVAPWIIEHAGEFAEGAIVTDAAGVKQPITDAIASVAANAKWTFLGAHPMAGKEKSGYSNASANLFKGAAMVLTPTDPKSSAAVDFLKELFSSVGFTRFAVTTPADHDAMIAYTSQLAHVVSTAYVQDELAFGHRAFSAGSFADMTRVAASDPNLWADLFTVNRAALVPVLDRFIARLTALRGAIAADDREQCRETYATGREYLNPNMSNIYLYGPPGSGKSTIGKLVASALGRELVDLDAAIEAGEGRKISDIFATDGEPAFRQLEREYLDKVGRQGGLLVSLGGGCLVNPVARRIAESTGKVVFLDCPEEVLVGRVKRSQDRPLLAGQAAEKLSRLLANRREHYASFVTRVKVDDSDPSVHAAKILELVRE